MAKRKQGQQPKWEAFTEAMDKVLNSEHPIGYAIIWTDEQLLDAVNEQLDEEQHISYRTLMRYKAGEIKDESVLSVFVSQYKKALRLQVDNLFRKMDDAVPGGWQKYAWIAERKMDEWNLRSKTVDETPDVGRLVFRVMPDDSEGKDTDSD